MVEENNNDEFIVIGAGPVGLLAAILLVKEQNAKKVDVYEAHDSIGTRLQESYPIGLNTRGVQALDRASRDIAIAIRTQGFMVDGWKIYSGSRQVAEIPSGLVVGTTRSTINQTLYDEVRKHYQDKIRIHWGHRLKSLNTLQRQLIFDVRRKVKQHALQVGDEEEEKMAIQGHSNGAGKLISSSTPSPATVAVIEEELVLPAGHARVLACDGVWSRVRAYAEEHLQEEFCSQVQPWQVEFRLLFSRPGARVPGLDRRYHYVLNGIYVSIIQGDIWVLAIGIRDCAPDAERELLSAKEATPQRIKALREYVTKKAPLAAPLLQDADLHEYFTRKSFRGAIVKVNRLNLGEWIVLLGDAAHSVIPPTGEGFNSGAEDVEVLMDVLSGDGNLESPFASYSEVRLPDLYALYKLADDANLSSFAPNGPEKVARLLCKIFISILKTCGIFPRTCEDVTFGAESFPPQPYRDIVDMWEWQRCLLLPLSRLLVWPVFILFWIIIFPFKLLMDNGKQKKVKF